MVYKSMKPNQHLCHSALLEKVVPKDNLMWREVRMTLQKDFTWSSLSFIFLVNWGW